MRVVDSSPTGADVMSIGEPQSRSSSWRNYVSGINISSAVLFIASYFLATALGEHAYGRLSFPSPFWLPDSVLLCTLLLAPRKYWPLIAIFAFPIRLAVGPPVGTPLWFVLFSTTIDLLKGFITAWWLLRILKREVRLDTIREFMTFLAVAACIVPGISSIAGGAGRYLLGNPLIGSSLKWFLGDALAQAIATPAILYWYWAVRDRNCSRVRELLVLSGLLMAVLLFAFRYGSGPFTPVLTYAPVPFAIWAALRLRPLGTATSIAVTASASMLSAVEGTGLFSRGSNAESVVSLQLFLLAVAVPLLSLSIILDEKKLDLETLRESEEKFHRVFREAGVGMLVASLDGRYLAANSTFCKYMGYTEDELRQKTVEELTHPEDWPAFSRRLAEVAAESGSFQRVEKRCIHKTGRIVYTESSASLIRGANGEPDFFVGEVLDITERKHAEEVLQSVNRRLIDAQEKESARIARELHDDINQRIALLVFEMEQIRSGKPIAFDKLRQELGKLCQQATILTVDVQAISHRLHSSKLEYLGVIVAMRGHCAEFARQHNVRVDFTHDNAFPDLPNETSLCFFRVLQEALHNAVKHSGGQHFAARLAFTPREISLSISDSGKGFDPQLALGGTGLGLISMRERLRLVGGTLSIESKTGHGTTIRARAPVESAGAAEAAA